MTQGTKIEVSPEMQLALAQAMMTLNKAAGFDKREGTASEVRDLFATVSYAFGIYAKTLSRDMDRSDKNKWLEIISDVFVKNFMLGAGIRTVSDFEKMEAQIDAYLAKHVLKDNYEGSA